MHASTRQHYLPGLAASPLPRAAPSVHHTHALGRQIGWDTSDQSSEVLRTLPCISLLGEQVQLLAVAM